MWLFCDYGFAFTEEFNIARRTGKVPATLTGHSRIEEGEEGGQRRTRKWHIIKLDL